MFHMCKHNDKDDKINERELDKCYIMKCIWFGVKYEEGMYEVIY